MTKQLICSTCGFVGSPAQAVRGSLGVEIFLWLCFLVPGIIYSLWRQSTYHKACPVCGNATLIPLESPVGQKMLKEQGKTVEQVQTKEAMSTGKTKIIYAVCGVVVVLWFIGYLASLV